MYSQSVTSFSLNIREKLCKSLAKSVCFHLSDLPSVILNEVMSNSNPSAPFDRFLGGLLFPQPKDIPSCLSFWTSCVPAVKNGWQAGLGVRHY